MRAKTTHRTAVTVLFFTIVLCLITAGGCKSASERMYRAYSGTVSVSLGLGREGILVEEHPFPVTVHVDGDYAKEGKTCVLTVPTNASDYYAYRKPLSEEVNRRSRLLSLQRNTAVRLQLNFLIAMSVSFTAEHVPIRHMMNGRICF